MGKYKWEIRGSRGHYTVDVWAPSGKRLGYDHQRRCLTNSFTAYGPTGVADTVWGAKRLVRRCVKLHKKGKVPFDREFQMKGVISDGS